MASDRNAFNYLENRRLKGLAVTGSDLWRNFRGEEVKNALTKQRKKLFPPKSGSDEDIMDTQSKMRKMFSK